MEHHVPHSSRKTALCGFVLNATLKFRSCRSIRERMRKAFRPLRFTVAIATGHEWATVLVEEEGVSGDSNPFEELKIRS